ncbi:MAG: hypothetical protein MK052_10365 [Alphaproteobacteria bacterium]|nr:hypothetical protein [Alphaproteobacteria bacterium]
MDQVTTENITALDALLTAGKRGEFYVELAKIYANFETTSQSAIDQILIQAQITTGGGSWGGAAILGNAVAQQNAGDSYNVTLDDFSLEIAKRLLDGIKADFDNGKSGLFTADEIQLLDASVWNDNRYGFQTQLFGSN